MLNPDAPFKSALPDVASETHQQFATALEWVGMRGIEIPLRLRNENGEIYQVPAMANALVSLDRSEARGIHMSRLFRLTQEKLSAQVLSFSLLRDLLKDFLTSHADLSSSAKVSVEFQALIERQALRSHNRGWRTYPVKLLSESIQGKARDAIETTVIYSSTCPASAALARQLIQENFKAQFRGDDPLDFRQVYDWLGTSRGINATPHAQRSFARAEVEVDTHSPFQFMDLIDLMEDTLQTAVQTAVKREDEQEFALRSGQNLMFCEDAARRLQSAFVSEPEIKHFMGEVRHVESLHPHDAVSLFRG